MELCGSLVVTLLLAGSLTDATWLYQPTGGGRAGRSGATRLQCGESGVGGDTQKLDPTTYIYLYFRTLQITTEQLLSTPTFYSNTIRPRSDLHLGTPSTFQSDEHPYSPTPLHQPSVSRNQRLDNSTQRPARHSH